jgi:glutamine amidotransferase
LLFDRSEESPGVEGLGLLRGDVCRLETDRKVPHIGWSDVRWTPGAVFAPEGEAGGAAASTYYFVHSYACVPSDQGDVLGTADHGVEFVAAAGRGVVSGVQFHPEKSSIAGLALLGRWLDSVRLVVAA